MVGFAFHYALFDVGDFAFELRVVVCVHGEQILGSGLTLDAPAIAIYPVPKIKGRSWQLEVRHVKCKASYPSPADLEHFGSTLSDVIEQAESGDIG